MSPAGRFAHGSAQMGPLNLERLFYTELVWVVRKDGTVRLNNDFYEVGLARRSLEVRFGWVRPSAGSDRRSALVLGLKGHRDYANFNYAATASTGVSGSDVSRDEPGQPNDPSRYFGLWAAGKNFAICAWNSGPSERFQAVGDPFVSE
jgi:hypothetical protein